MKINCPGCQAAFSVQDKKIPAGKELKILCPKCRTAIELKGSRENAVSPENRSDQDLNSECGGAELERSGADLVEEGKQAALLCVSDPGRLALLQDALHSLGFQCFVASSSHVALNKMQHNHYELILLDESLGGEGVSDNVLLQHFRLLPMHLRRKFFLCLLSGRSASLDRFAAFRMGVDLILNLADMSKCRALFERTIRERAGFYRIFRTELEKRGQF